MEEILKEIRDDVKTLLVSDGRKDERLKSLERTRTWIFGILGTVAAAIVISTII